MCKKAVSVVDGPERHGLPVKLHFWKLLEGLILPDLEEVTHGLHHRDNANEFKEGEAAPGSTSTGAAPVPSRKMTWLILVAKR